MCYGLRDLYVHVMVGPPFVTDLGRCQTTGRQPEAGPAIGRDGWHEPHCRSFTDRQFDVAWLSQGEKFRPLHAGTPWSLG
jgi:hypothetical protein